MTTISFMNKKGGTGKTTTVVSTAVILKELGYKVLVVDLDQQGNSGNDLLNIETEGENTVLEVIKGDCTIKEAIQRSTMPALYKEDKYENLVLDSDGNKILIDPSADRGIDCVASDSALSELAFSGAALPGVQFRLRAALDEVRDDYDFCLIDCPPAVAFETTIALTASDFIVVPTNPTYFAIKGYFEVHKVISDVLKWYNPDIKMLGVLITNYDSRTNHSRGMSKSISEYAEKLGTFTYETKIRRAVKVEVAHNHGRTVIEYSPNSNASKDYRSFVDELLAALDREGK